MASIKIRSDPFDAAFRDIVAAKINEARKTIKIVTGEIAAYNYHDLRTAAEEAAERGVDIEVYATGPDRDIINRLIHNKIKVYIGKDDPKEHFMICDGKEIVISEKGDLRTKPTPMGNRRGRIVNSRSELRRHIQIFKRLISKAVKARMEGEDPLVRALREPVSAE